ncbi:type II secretion system secretin GspD [Sphingomonas sp. BGYR3]|uniref:type II secretion system secretin GspD n=1 Tax=Sphingomonas sp. BGYR3 TaxID=2975483 RepID=UPI0021A92263|nr:type II secretion system secretin GspD [Sphingomonas sp. BGYR3]
MRHPIQTLLLATAMTTFTVQPILAQSAETADVVVNMRDVDITTVADQVSRITGRTLILDPQVKGNVTVTSASPLSPAGVWDLFLSVLRANGFAAVRSGRGWRVVPAANAVRDGGVPTRSASGEQLVTRMVRLSNVPAAEAARIVRPLIAVFGSVEPLDSPNAIVVTDYADNVRRVEQIVRSLDGGGGQTFAAIPLRNGSAEAVAESIQRVMGEGQGAGTTRVAADARSNTVIVRGTPSAVDEARRMVVALDAPGGATPQTRVFRLNYADAESVTEVLRGTLGIEAGATNPVARSLQSRSRAGASSTSPTAAVAGLIAANQQAQANGGSGQSGTPLQLPSETTGGRAETPQGFSTPDITVQPAPEINALVVRATPTMIASIETVIRELDVRRPQVMIEAAIAEITGDDAEALGVQLGTSAAVLNQVEGAGTSFNTAGPSLGQILSALDVPAAALFGSLGGFNGNIAIGDTFSLLVQALGQSTRANLLSKPQVTVLDNSPAEFIAGQEVPFITGSILTGNGTANPFTTIERKDVGITLRVLPRVNAGETVRLEIVQEASSLPSGIPASAADLITNRRQISTTVLADDGEVIVLGGLITDDRSETRQKVPVLGDIPVLGELFRSRRETQQKRTLFIFLKPTIIRDTADAAALTREKMDRLRQEEERLGKYKSLLIDRPPPRLSLELDGIY